MKVLFIEDYALAAALVRDSLQRKAPDIELEIVSSIESALQRLGMPAQKDSHSRRGISAPMNFDAVLTDLNLPDGSGLEILQRLRVQGASLPVIILTGSVSDAIVKEALDAGASAVFDKQSNYLQLLPEALADAVLTASRTVTFLN